MAESKNTKILPKGRLLVTADPTAMLDVAARIVEAYKEWQVVKEQETTKRQDIAARRDAIIAKIRSDRKVLVTYMKGQFDTQGAALDGLFDGLDKALAAGDPNLVGPILNSIVDVVKTSPLGDLLTLDQRMKDNSFTFVLGDG